MRGVSVQPRRSSAVVFEMSLASADPDLARRRRRRWLTAGTNGTVTAIDVRARRVVDNVLVARGHAPRFPPDDTRVAVDRDDGSPRAPR